MDRCTCHHCFSCNLPSEKATKKQLAVDSRATQIPGEKILWEYADAACGHLATEVLSNPGKLRDRERLDWGRRFT
jgi:hypothetical protein